MTKPPLTKLKDILPKVKSRFVSLSDSEVLVGVPRDKGERRDTTGMTNAMLALIHDTGSPVRNIPARPFMKPGIAAAKSGIIKEMKRGGRKVLKGDEGEYLITLHRIGLIAQLSIRSVINEGIPPPLTDSTLKGRIRSRRGKKGAIAELISRKSGNMPALTLSKPLINTGQLRNAISYVIRAKK